jgi:hypothetical protein
MTSKIGSPRGLSSMCLLSPWTMNPTASRRQPTAHPIAALFAGKYSHQIVKGNAGHNLPQEAPQAFAQAVVEVDGY